MGDEEEEEEEVGKTSATEKEAKQKKGGAGGLLPFTLVSPMLVSLIVIVAIKILPKKKNSNQTLIDPKHPESHLFFFYSYCAHFISFQVQHKSVVGLFIYLFFLSPSPYANTGTFACRSNPLHTDDTERTERRASYLGYGPNRGILLQAGSIGGIN